MADIGAQQAPDDLIELGRIVSAYGVRGWVKVQPHSAQSLVLRAAPVWWLTPPIFSPPPSFQSAESSDAVKFRPHTVKQVRPQGASIVADLEQVDDRDLAESLRGYTVHVSRQFFPKAQADEFYWVDLENCYVYSDAQLVGLVLEVVDNGAHAILRVQRMGLEGDQVPSEEHPPTVILDTKGRPEEILVPFVAAHVQHVDIAARRIETDWPLEL